MQWTAVQIARAAWTRITEPTDKTAQALIELFGADIAYDVVLGRRGLDEVQIGNFAFKMGNDKPDATLGRKMFATALMRWEPRLDHIESEVRRDLSILEHMGGTLWTPADWPSQLNDLVEDAPFALWVRGDLTRFPAWESLVAVVGSRDATTYGQSVTNDFAGQLAYKGYTIVSGGAYGVDAAAHRAALGRYYGSGDPLPTVAVVASGIDRFYPTGNEQLLRDITEKGLMISERPPSSSPTRYAFLQRNRIIAALASATVVTEARWRSGALRTAEHAFELDRVTGAVPGSVYSANSAGCHRLIREGKAELMMDARELMERLNGSSDV